MTNRIGGRLILIVDIGWPTPWPYDAPTLLPMGCERQNETTYIVAECDDESTFIEMAASNLVYLDFITYDDAPCIEFDHHLFVDGRLAYTETIDEAKAFDADEGGWCDGWTDMQVRAGAIFGCSILPRILAASWRHAKLQPPRNRWKALSTAGHTS